MVWTTPRTWTAGEPLTATKLNEISAQLNALKAPPTSIYKQALTTAYTTTSATFANVDGTNLSLAVTSTGGDIWVCFNLVIGMSTNAQHGHFDITTDGVAEGGTNGIASFTNGANERMTICVQMLKSGLSAGTHTFNLQFRVTGGATLTVYVNDATGLVKPFAWAREV